MLLLDLLIGDLLGVDLGNIRVISDVDGIWTGVVKDETAGDWDYLWVLLLLLLLLLLLYVCVWLWLWLFLGVLLLLLLFILWECLLGVFS